MYLKFTAHKIFDGNQWLPPQTAVVTNVQGIVQAILPAADAGDGVQQLPGIICPGFINAHCHTELSHLQGQIPMHTGLVQFVQQVIGSRQGSGAQAIQQSIQQGIQQMAAGGIVAVGDICNTTDSVAAKQASGLHWHNFIEVAGFVPAAAASRLADMQAVKAAFDAVPGSNTIFTNSLAPHAPYSVSGALFTLINRATAQGLTSIHNQESPAEDELYLHKTGDFLQLYQQLGIQLTDFAATGKSSLQSWLPYFTQGQQIISVHNSYSSPAAIAAALATAAALQQQLYFCICINANLYIQNTLPPVALLQQQGCTIVVGTDSLASNQQLSIWQELCTLQQHFTQLPLATLLQWATSNGARALRMEGLLGTIGLQKQPGLVHILQHGEHADPRAVITRLV
ncbi:MAG: hypothetical protein RL172_183 [Bacteroidota bacterium]